jgi:predicted TIM-barrel fold metal-dependent hydrolase
VYGLVVEAVGPEKILFGSDYPLLIYPRRTRLPGFIDLLAEVRDSGLPPEQLELVLGGNIQRLLNL